MPWDMNKCVNGVPPVFTNVDATNLVNGANFANAPYVNTSNTRATRQAFVEVAFGAWTVTVVGHIHVNPVTGAFTAAGNSYIPGWDGWSMATPAAACGVIFAMPDAGVFPGVTRYPHNP